MACTHLNELYQLCQQHSLRFSGSDLIHIVCKECGAEDTCPSMLRETAEGDDTKEDHEEDRAVTS